MYRFSSRHLRVDPILCGLFILAISLTIAVIGQGSDISNRPVVAELRFNDG